MNLGVYTACLPRLTPEEAIAAGCRLGYNGIEWRVENASFDTNPPAHFRNNNRCTLAPSVDEAERLGGLDLPDIAAVISAAAEAARAILAERSASDLSVSGLSLEIVDEDGEQVAVIPISNDDQQS